MVSYQRSANWILYLRDRAFKQYHFGKLSKEGWKALAEPDTGAAPDPFLKPALQAFYADYDLPEFRKQGMSKQAIKDLRRALKKKRVPSWALNLFSQDELKGG